jgi:hypothetical protein
MLDVGSGRRSDGLGQELLIEETFSQSWPALVYLHLDDLGLSAGQISANGQPSKNLNAFLVNHPRLEHLHVRLSDDDIFQHMEWTLLFPDCLSNLTHLALPFSQIILALSEIRESSNITSLEVLPSSLGSDTDREDNQKLFKLLCRQTRLRSLALAISMTTSDVFVDLLPLARTLTSLHSFQIDWASWEVITYTREREVCSFSALK